MFGFGILFWILIIWLAFGVFRHENGCFGGNCHESFSDSDNALEILRKRFAKGEISKEEFERMKSDLQ